jgi:hypothetical protein
VSADLCDALASWAVIVVLPFAALAGVVRDIETVT